ncbi:hypothetical protein JCM19376_18130 [Fusibacter bizertensis]
MNGLAMVTQYNRLLFNLQLVDHVQAVANKYEELLKAIAFIELFFMSKLIAISSEDEGHEEFKCVLVTVFSRFIWV